MEQGVATVAPYRMLCLAVSRMALKTTAIAQVLGRRGGLARAKRLSSEERKRIAASGGRARALSLQAERRILQSLTYAEAVKDLQGGAPPVKRLKRCPHPLPRLSK